MLKSAKMFTAFSGQEDVGSGRRTAGEFQKEERK
jgi:hypothetical protein